MIPRLLKRSATLVVGVVALASCKGASDPNRACSKLPLAPESARVDRFVPVFSAPLNITNPLFPISRLHAAVLLGNVNGVPLRVETTLLPTVRTISLNGKQIATNESQYVAFLNGRIEEVALDWYAQADGGSVWYLGEDVFNFENGVVANREGTWLAGREGPAAMIMPATPKVGDVFRPENVCGVVFEEVTVKAVGVTVSGPVGPVSGAIVTSELHMDGSREDKTFAPGYGEFSTGSGTNLEAIALAVPTDALPGTVPAELETMQSGAMSIFDAAAAIDWPRASASLLGVTAAWSSFRLTTAPPALAAQLTTALNALTTATNARNASAARQSAIDVARATLDFRLRYRPPTEVDRARFDLWAAQILVDAAANSSSGVRGDVATMEYLRQRFAHALGAAVLGQVDGLLTELRAAANAGNFVNAASAATRLRIALAAR